jgi:hypothetical protein
MKNVCWTLFVLSIAAFVIGGISRLTPNGIPAGVVAGTYWKAAMAFLAYAVALRILTEERRAVV